MKKSLVIIAFIALVAGCKNGTSETSNSNILALNDPQISLGLQMIAKSDCQTCHRVSEKTTGPAYEEVAGRYPYSKENVSLLAEKIRRGGSGNWGQIQMLPHPDISEDNAKMMVKYILSLKK